MGLQGSETLNSVEKRGEFNAICYDCCEVVCIDHELCELWSAFLTVGFMLKASTISIPKSL